MGLAIEYNGIERPRRALQQNQGFFLKNIKNICGMTHIGKKQLADCFG
jgi:hypothetical protein